MICKINKLNFFFAIIAAAFLGSCERELDTPPISKLDPTLGQKISSVNFLRDFYKSKNTSFVTLDMDSVIEAVVIANDKSGNFHRQIIIKDASGGIELKINDNNLYERFPVGQKIYLKTQGLVMGQYGGLIQLGGSVYNSGSGDRLGGIEADMISKHIIRLSGGQVPEPAVVEIGTPIDAHLYTMVRLANVQFAESELTTTFANPNQTTNRSLINCQGKSIIVRTSSFAEFSTQQIPQGNGTITAILTKFNQDYQLIINDINDVTMNDARCEIPGQPRGTGTFDNPFNVSAAISNNTGTRVWVEGYIVGVRETDVEPNVNNFTGPWRTATNIILADSPDDPQRLLMIQLPIGDVRTALNLVNNPSKKGVYAKLRGDLATYFSVPGMRNTFQYWLSGMPDPGPDIIALFNENFATSLGSFTAFDRLGTQKWVHQTWDGGSAVMSGFAGSAFANEDWLISPQINLEGKSNVKLTLREAINHLTKYDDLQVLVSSDFAGTTPWESVNWTKLTGFTRAAGNNWTFVESGEISLTEFEGKKIHIALKYNSTTSGASTWQVSRVTVTANE
jgi:hypothetical protein